jgi:hypothetical protein
MDWDLFISHASEDKASFVRPLAETLTNHGVRVWYDEFTIKLGDSLRRSIDNGLSRSRFGVVVISPSFLQKEWPQKELDGLVAREVAGVKVILPVWHGVDSAVIREYSPMLADKVAISSDKGIRAVAEAILDAIGPSGSPVGASSSAMPLHSTIVAKRVAYCERCGAIPGPSTRCSPGYSAHSFVAPARGKLFCPRCGATPGAPTHCSPGYSTHDFSPLPSVNFYCARCGAKPGPATRCSPGYSAHDFVSGSASGMYCSRCGAIPGSPTNCSPGYSSHSFGIF